jgi:hypothetical protein
MTIGHPLHAYARGVMFLTPDTRPHPAGASL